MSEICVANKRADARAAVREPLDAIKTRQARNVDDPVRAGGADFHEIDQVGAAREIDCPRLCRSRDSLGDRSGSEVLEHFHCALSPSPADIFRCASSTASWIPT